VQGAFIWVVARWGRVWGSAGPRGHAVSWAGWAVPCWAGPSRRWALSGRHFWGGARARADTGFMPAQPINIHVRSCLWRAKNVILWDDPLSLTRMARYVFMDQY
jgi:hypothetical protein